MISETVWLAAVAFAGGFGGVKASLNGTKKRVERIEDKVDDVSTRVARMEGHLGVEQPHSGD